MAPSPIPVCIVSLGCAKNLVDTEVMAGSLAQAGFILTPDQEDARILLINTCSFIKDARTEALDEIDNALAWKAAAPRRKRKVVVTGCLPQRDLPGLLKRYPGVDLFLQLDDVPRVHEKFAAMLTGSASAAAPQPSTWLYDHNTPRMLLTAPTFAYVKIAEGCDHGCRFCAIPAIRGRQRSRDIASIVKECDNLLGMGVKELNFIAQDSTRYGLDRRDGSSLAKLLRECDQLAGDFWIRVLYTHPRHLTDELLATLAHATHVVPYLDMPLQHISSSVLRAMGRGMDGPETRALLAKIRATVPNITFRTTFLVGFPGETEADFQELLTLVKEFRFDRLGVFAFSPEEGTPAAALTDGLVPTDVAEARREAILEAQQEIAQARNNQFVGKNVRVLAEVADSARKWSGRTSGDAPEVDNVVHVRGPVPADGFCDVRITQAGPYELTGETVPTRKR